MTGQSKKVERGEGEYKMAEVKSLKQDKLRGIFLFENTDHTYLNTLRRIITNRVPVMAIDEVKFMENGSAMYDEQIALRLGLVSLTTDLESYFVRDKCKCKGEGCARCTLDLTLNKAGPCTVYASDLKSKDPAVKPMFPNTPITKLLEGQTLKFEAKAILGTGKVHAKFVPGLMFYTSVPKFKVKDAKEAKKLVEESNKVLESDGKKLALSDYSKTDFALSLVEDHPDAVEVEMSSTDYVVTIESWGQLSVKELMSRAIEVLDEELDELEAEIKDLK